MKKLSTKVSTGDSFEYNGQNYIVGNWRKIDNKSVIELKVSINKTSCYTDFVSTKRLNQMTKHI